MKKRFIILIIAIVTMITCFSQNESNVVTDSAILVGNDGVKLYATITNVCNCAGNVHVGFRLITMTDPNVPYIVNVDCPVHYSQGMTTYLFDTIGLVVPASYSYVAYIEDATGINYGDVKTFVTGNSALNTVDTNNISVSLYPNPAKEETTLSFSSLLSKAKVLVVDLQGKVSNSIELQPQTSSYILNTSNLKSGVYYVIIENDKGSIVKKLIKE